MESFQFIDIFGIENPLIKGMKTFHKENTKIVKHIKFPNCDNIANIIDEQKDTTKIK